MSSSGSRHLLAFQRETRGENNWSPNGKVLLTYKACGDKKLNLDDERTSSEELLNQVKNMKTAWKKNVWYCFKTTLLRWSSRDISQTLTLPLFCIYELERTTNRLGFPHIEKITSGLYYNFKRRLRTFVEKILLLNIYFGQLYLKSRFSDLPGILSGVLILFTDTSRSESVSRIYIKT